MMEPKSRAGWWGPALAIAIVLGAVLRLIWVQDIEYKYDENWIFQQTQSSPEGGPFSWTGMRASVRVANPGMSIWVFQVPSKLIPLNDPTDLARLVQLLSIAALVLLVWFALRVVPQAEREPWLWAIALAAVNPLTVLFQRKIWPPSILPIFCTIYLIAWFRRERGWAAFACGLVGACLGQIHLSGFFFVAGLILWLLLFDRRRMAWLWWLAGSIIGAMPMLPWLHDLFLFGAEQALKSRMV